MSKNNQTYAMLFADLCTYMIPNVFSNVQHKEIRDFIRGSFIWLPVNGVISPLPPLIAVTSLILSRVTKEVVERD